MDITLVIARQIAGNPCIIIKSIDNLFFIVIFIVKKIDYFLGFVH